MNKRYFRQCFTALFCGLATVASAQVALPSVFTDHMVLQQQSSAPVWGWGYANQPVKVVGSWAPGDTVTAMTQADGHWQVSIPTTAAGGPYTLHVIGDKTIILQDVMLGEVWLCSGQSNMEWTANAGLTNKDAEIAAANHPNIRFFHIPRRGAAFPQDDCDAAWAACTPQTMPNTSAVAYFFARKLQEEKDVPVGLIVSAWGGTPAEVWTPNELITGTPALKDNLVDKENPWWPNSPGALYNQMIHPVVPYRIAGSLWYQGESNHEKYATYGLLMKKLIEGWRADFGKDMPFYFVQIAPFKYGSKENTPALLREQQEFVSRLVPNTGMVVISDLVDNVGDIHPISKQQVGVRLARLALAETYGEKLSDYKSPVYKSMEVKKNKAILSFLDADGGLLCKGKKVEGLQIAGADGVWQPAEGEVKGSTLVVSARGVKIPTQVRYCFDDATEGNLFTIAGLPVAPFRTDREMKIEK